MKTSKQRGVWQRWVPYSLMLGDAVAFFAAFYWSRLAHAFYYGENPVWVLGHWWGSAAEINLLLFFLLATIGILVFLVKGHYARRKVFWDEVGEIFAAFTLLLALNSAIAFGGHWMLSRLWLFTTWLLALLFVPLIRLLLRWALLRLGLWRRHVAIIGSGQNALEAMRALESDPMLGMQVRWLLLPEDSEVEPDLSLPEGVSMQQLGSNALATLATLGNPQTVLALEQRQWESHEPLLRTLGLHYPHLTIAPPLRGLPLFGLEVMHFFSHEVLMLRVRDNLGRPWPRLMKRCFDVLAGTVLVILLLPAWIWISWQIWRSDRGPVFYAQERIGRNGQAFRCLKFRSMVMDADQRLASYLAAHPELQEEYDRTFKLKDDPRVTSIGKFLRKTSLDELPQLFNVLRGEMSLVGPRPVVRKELDKYYGDAAALYKMVRPGITGLWQVSGRSDTTYSERVYLDSWYVKNWALWYDIVILLRTVKVVFRREGAY
ncbi:undecaprenyl-phosphate galactose phosphotransferase WbaP [Acidithiobacillus acidisediminis]|uniref:undecaprenyl-phosphate galactose phosphotransferase WbaP n=1 Tax=Acidithiobacillus acidisediminis TaxID=2937799 RepID=UPI00200EF61A|nr:undecaprenyl-phosphate galactose phosphotransferase WbaP [Acidithiobacillus sp. S30A2]